MYNHDVWQSIRFCGILVVCVLEVIPVTLAVKAAYLWFRGSKDHVYEFAWTGVIATSIAFYVLCRISVFPTLAQSQIPNLVVGAGILIGLLLRARMPRVQRVD